MYTQRVKFQFFDSIQQSERMRFLAELAERLEASEYKSTVSPGFSIIVKANGETTVDVWQPGKFEALSPVLRAGEARKLFPSEEGDV